MGISGGCQTAHPTSRSGVEFVFVTQNKLCQKTFYPTLETVLGVSIERFFVVIWYKIGYF